MNVSVKTLLVAAGILSSASALAQPFASNQVGPGDRPTYNYVQGGWRHFDFDDSYICDQDGPFLNGSIVLSDQLFAEAGYIDIDGDCSGSSTSSAGVGLRSDFGNSSSIYGVARLLIRDYGGDTDAGVGLSGGIRTYVSPGVELNARVGMESVDEADQIYVGGGVSYWVTTSISLIGDVTLNDDGDRSLGLGARFHF